MGDGKCPDIYECRMGVDKILRQTMKNKMKLKALSKELRLLRELENVVRYGHGKSYGTLPKRDEDAVLIALQKLHDSGEREL